ncbi:LPS export ABC transporter permease LptF [Nitrospina gracilis]|uniref:LPS export ABC transporter permease LptF n=1 Tax=Nitrospina gracilis TaxID=35801 RepID=UPI001F0089C7|nr:LPS export ABC transporter permease LptF [Nitrospina gracilis]MCF8720793.1 lipopolysaccharide export system permease protein [Nitrospina gracilis Nb-211]
MKIIHRYIFTEMLKIFVISTLALTMVLFMDKVLFITDLVFNRGVTLPEVARMIFYITPGFLGLTIPISVLVAAIVVFNQLSADSEYVVMKASGWSFLYLLRPVFYFSLAAFIITNLNMFYFLPWGGQQFQKMVYDIVRTRANIDIKPNVFNKDFEGLTVFVNNKEGNHELRGIFISHNPSENDAKIILADEGTIVSDSENYRIHLQLRNGSIHDANEPGTRYQIIKFQRYDLNLNLPTAGKMRESGFFKHKDKSVSDLWQLIQEKERAGQPSNFEKVELSKKFSIPFTCLLFGLIGGPLGIKSSRSGKSGGFVVAVAIILLYYVGLISGQNLGKGGEIPALLSVWIPNIVLFFFTTYVLYKVHKEIPFTLVDRVTDAYLTLLDVLKRLKPGAHRTEPHHHTTPNL